MNFHDLTDEFPHKELIIIYAANLYIEIFMIQDIQISDKDTIFEKYNFNCGSRDLLFS